MIISSTQMSEEVVTLTVNFSTIFRVVFSLRTKDYCSLAVYLVLTLHLLIHVFKLPVITITIGRSKIRIIY